MLDDIVYMVIVSVSREVKDIQISYLLVHLGKYYPFAMGESLGYIECDVAGSLHYVEKLKVDGLGKLERILKNIKSTGNSIII